MTVSPPPSRIDEPEVDLPAADLRQGNVENDLYPGVGSDGPYADAPGNDELEEIPPEKYTGLEKASAAGEPDPFAPSVAKIQFCLSLLQIFVVSLTIRICFNFFTTHPNISFVGDASEYLREATALSTPALHSAEFLKHAFELLVGTASPATTAIVHQQTAVLDELKVAGPVFPLFLLSTFALGAQLPNVGHWQLPVLVQCIVSSWTCVIIALAARRAWNRTVGVTAGAIAAIYPSFIISTGSLYTETFTVFLYSCIAFISVRSIVSKPASNVACVLLGFLTAALQLTRPPAAIISLLTFPFIAWQRKSKRPLIALLSLIAGFAIILAPYVLMQKVAFDTASLIVNRRASENLFMGNNNQTQGWTATPFGWMPPEKERTAFVIKHSLANPRQTAQLLVDKLIRLFKFPFNDYRMALGPFNFASQALFHQLIILSAAVGLALALFTSPRVEIEFDEKQASLKRRIQGRLCLLTICGSNIVYIAFVAMSRYLNPAMPIVIMFAAAGLVTLVTCLRNKSIPLMLTAFVAVLSIIISSPVNFATLLLKTGTSTSIPTAQAAEFALRLVPILCISWVIIALIRSTAVGAKRMAYIVTALLLSIIIPSACLPSRANGRGLETTYILDTPGQALKQTVTVPSSVGPAYLLLDAAGISSLSGLDIFINGSKVAPVFIPNLSMIPVSHFQKHAQGNSFYLEVENLFHCLSLPCRSSISDLRQWFLVPIPQSVTETANGASSGGLRTLQIELRKTNFATTCIYGQFARNTDNLMIPAVSGQSTEKPFYSVESLFHLGDPRFDMRAKLLHTPDVIPQRVANQNFAQDDSWKDHFEKDAEQNTSKELKQISAMPNIRVLSTPEANSLNTEETSISLPDKQIEGGQRELISIQPVLPSSAQADIALLRFHGKIKALRGEPKPHLALEVFSGKSGQVMGYDSPWMPTVLPTANTWQDFNFTVPIPVADLPGAVQALNIWISDGDPQQQLLRKPHTKSLFTLKEVSVSVSQLTKRPLEPGYIVY